MSYGWFPRLNARGEVVSGGLGIVAYQQQPIIDPWAPATDPQKALEGYGPQWLTDDQIVFNAPIGVDGETHVLDLRTRHRQLAYPFGYNDYTAEHGSWAGSRPGFIHLHRPGQPMAALEGGAPLLRAGRFAYRRDGNYTLIVDGQVAVNNTPIMNHDVSARRVAWIKATSTYGRQAYVDGALISFDSTEGAIWLFDDEWVMTQYSGGYKIRRIGESRGLRIRTSDAYFPAVRRIGDRLFVAASTGTGAGFVWAFDIAAIGIDDLTAPDPVPHTDAPHADTPPHVDLPPHVDVPPHSDHADQPHADTPTPPSTPRLVAFGPSPGSVDMQRLFTEPQEWEWARARTSVFHFILANILDFTDLFLPNSYDNLVAAGAFRKLKEWGILAELQTDGAWEDNIRCTERIEAAGGELSFIIYDKAFHEIDPDDFANRVRNTRAALPNLKGMGVFAAFPFKSPDDIRRRLVEFDRRGARPDYLRLDVDPGRRDALTPAVFQQFRDMCSDRGIALQYVINAPDGTDDRAYVEHAKQWYERNRGLGKWDNLIVQSWATRSGRFVVPHNLPEHDPTSHTALLRYVMERELA